MFLFNIDRDCRHIVLNPNQLIFHRLFENCLYVKMYPHLFIIKLCTVLLLFLFFLLFKNG